MRAIHTSIKSLQTTFKIKNIKFSFKNLIPYIIILLLTFVLMFMSCSRLKNVGIFWDPAVYLNVSRNMLQGKVLYKDIVDNKGPILYFINAFGLKIGGQNGVVFIEFIFIYITLLFAYKSSKLISKGKTKSIFITLISFSYLFRFFMYGLACEEYGLAFSMITLYMCLKFYTNNNFSTKQCFWIGFLCSLTFFIRPNLIVVFVAFGIGIGLKLLFEKRIKELFKYALYAFMGFFTACIPFLIYLIKNNCFDEFVSNVFIVNTTMNKLGIDKSIKKIICFIPITSILVYIYWLVSIYKLIIKKDMERLSIIALIIVTLLFNCISKEIYLHYFIMFIPVLLIMFNHILKIKKTNIMFLPVWFLVFMIFIYNVYVSSSLINTPQPNKYIIEYVKNNTSENDKIAVLGFFDEIYYLSNREPVSKYTYVLPNNAFSREIQINILNEYFNDIIEKKPKIIIEDLSTMESAVSPYITLDDYEKLKKDYYTCDNYLLTMKAYRRIQ